MKKTAFKQGSCYKFMVSKLEKIHSKLIDNS